tara:strand:+ start:1494 stop:1931 length:438 start_codon:yes stop_codon:yes gene_type:complete
MSKAALVGRGALWAYENPYTVFGAYIGIRYAPMKMWQATLALARFKYAVSPATVKLGYELGTIVLGARGVATAKVASKAGIYGAAAALGVGVGVVAGTAISRAAFGVEGKDSALKFYSGQANWYDYIPHYNAYKIVRHYAKEAIE